MIMINKEKKCDKAVYILHVYCLLLGDVALFCPSSRKVSSERHSLSMQLEREMHATKFSRLLVWEVVNFCKNFIMIIFCGMIL